MSKLASVLVAVIFVTVTSGSVQAQMEVEMNVPPSFEVDAGGSARIFVATIRNMKDTESTVSFAMAVGEQPGVAICEPTVLGVTQQGHTLDNIGIRIKCDLVGQYFDTMLVTYYDRDSTMRFPFVINAHGLSVGEKKDADLTDIQLFGNRLKIAAGAKELFIYDVTGRSVFAQASPDEWTDLSHLLREKMYLVTVMLTDGRRVTKKIVL